MRNQAKKAFSLLLALVMCLSVMSVGAFAAEVSDSKDAVASATVDGETKLYDSLQSAIDAVPDNGTATITLLANVTAGSGLATDSTNADKHPKNLTIDLGTYTYTVEDPAVGSTNTKSQAMHWAENSTIVIKNGTINTSENASGIKMFLQNYADLTFESVVLDASKIPASTYGAGYEKYPVWYGKTVPLFGFNKGNAEIKGNSEIKYGSESGSIAVGDKGGTLKIEDSAVKIGGQFLLESNAAGVLTISGGTYASDPSQVTYMGASNTYIDCVKTGYKATTNDGTWTVREDDTNYVVRIGTTKYATLQDAINAVQDNQTIVLQADATENVTINNGKEFTIDMGAKTLTGAVNLGHGFVTFANGKLVKDGGQTINVWSTKNSANATGAYNKLTIAGDATVEGAYGIILREEKIDGNYGHGYGSQIDIKGTVEGYIWIMGGMIAGNSVVNVYNGAHIAGQLQQAGYCTVNVMGGKIDGKNVGIETRAGILNVTGGTITTPLTAYTCTANGNGTTTEGAGIAIAQHTTKLDIQVSISGSPNISGPVALSIANPQENTTSDALSVNVTGGTFTAKQAGEDVVSVLYRDSRFGLSISGGTFSGTLDGNYIADGFTQNAAGKVVANSPDVQVSTILDGGKVAITLVGATPDTSVNMSGSEAKEAKINKDGVLTAPMKDMNAKIELDNGGYISIADQLRAVAYTSSDENARNVAKATLNFGEAAAAYFGVANTGYDYTGYGQDNQANSFMNDLTPVANVKTALESVQLGKADNDNRWLAGSEGLGGLKYIGVSLVLKSNTSLRLNFEATKNFSVENYPYSVTVGGTAYNLVPREEGSNYYYAEIATNILPQELDNSYAVTCDSSTFSVTVSPLSYAKIVLNNTANTGTKLETLARALYDYYDKANYAVSHN